MKHPDASPLVAAAALMGEWTEAAVAAEAAGLAALKAEMEGLAVLFGGTSEPQTDAAEREREARVEAGFDNMPI